MRILAVISARYKSERFPGKLLEKIFDKTILEWVIDYCRQIKYFTDIIVATDDVRIENFIHSKYIDINTIKMDEPVRCATERMFRVYSIFKNKYSLYVSIPADEPFVNYEEINSIFPNILQTHNTENIITLYTKFYNEEDLKSKLSCKIVTNIDDYAIYFSRAVIPATKNGEFLSFPSRHTAFAFLIAATFPTNRRGKFALYLWATLVALSRLVLAEHWLSDVVFGAGVGLLLSQLPRVLEKQVPLTTFQS